MSIGWERKQKGFTIVELLIVIVVIGILAAIVIVAYSGVQTRANNATRYSELKTWRKQFELYYAQYGSYPAVADGGYCLGTGFPIGGGGVARCRDYGGTGVASYAESGNAGLMTELNKVATLPAPQRLGVNGTIGAYADYSATTILLTEVINGAPADCPTDAPSAWTDNAGRTLCRITITR